jgi:hypothetical protein
MALSDTQVRQLRAKLEAKHFRTRKANGTDLHFVEGWHVIAEANRIFGYDAWDRRTLSSNCVWGGQSGGCYGAAYTAKVRISVRAGEITIVREGSGTGEARPLPRGKLTSLPSKVLKPMPPSGLWPLSATPSVLLSMTESSLACGRPGPHLRSTHGSSAQPLVPKSKLRQAKRICCRLTPSDGVKPRISSSCSPSGSRMSTPCEL